MRPLSFSKQCVSFKSIQKYILLFLVFGATSCISAHKKSGDVNSITQANDTLLIWAHSDIQPRTIDERKQYETAVADMAGNIQNVYMAIVAGDIVDRKKRHQDDYDWFFRTRQRANIPYWYEIIGNHDGYYVPGYLKNVRNYLHYSVSLGNVLFIFMSNSVRTPSTVIPDDVFQWWKNLVISNQDKIIVTITHAAPKESRHFASNFPSMRMLFSKEFAKVMERYHVDVWISGHSHISQGMKRKWTKPEQFKKKTIFVEVSSIRNDFFSATESYILAFKNGSDEVVFLPRNHDEQAFVFNKVVSHKLSHPFTWNKRPPKLIRFQ